MSKKSLSAVKAKSEELKIPYENLLSAFVIEEAVTAVCESDEAENFRLKNNSILSLEYYRRKAPTRLEYVILSEEELTVRNVIHRMSKIFQNEKKAELWWKYRVEKEDEGICVYLSAKIEELQIPVQLVYTQYKVRFNTTPQNATVALYKNGYSGAYGDPILPDEQGYYTIIFGQYRYIVSAEGYTTVSKTFNATDTALKNNNYVITVKLESPADKLLSQADNALFSVSGDGLAMTEYSGVHSDPDFGHYADIDSDYQDVNVQSAIEAYLAKEVKSDYPITVTVDKVENDEWDCLLYTSPSPRD